MTPTFELDTVWIIHSSAQENNIEDSPWVIIKFTTAANAGWELQERYLSGDTVPPPEDETEYFIHTGEYPCTGEALSGYLCQTWEGKFFTEKHGCAKDKRQIQANYWAFIGGHNTTYNITMEVGGSSSFACAEDLGTFIVTAASRCKYQQEDAWSTICPTLYLEDNGWFEIEISSGAIIESVELMNMTIYTAEVGNNAVICELCQNDPDVYDNTNTNHWEFTFSFKFTRDYGFESLGYQMFLEFSITYSTGETGRRRMLLNLPTTESDLGVPLPFSLSDRDYVPPPTKPTDEVEDTKEISSFVEYDVRFNYDCSIIESPEKEELFRTECNALMHPTICKRTRCGSIIVTMSSPTASDRDAVVKTLAFIGLNLPSFGYADLLKLEEESDSTHAASGVLLYSIIAALFFSIIVAGIVYSKCRTRDSVELD
jgi:hypothetical protein